MHNALLSASLLFGIANAVTSILYAPPANPSSLPSGTCATIVVLDTCLATTKAVVAACGTSDYDCLCQTYTDIVQCFAGSGCPNDVRWQGFYSNQQSYCANKSIYTSAVATPISKDVSSAVSSVAASVSSAISNAKATATTGQKGAAKNTATGTATSGSNASQTGSGSGAMGLEVGFGGMVAGVVGVLGMVL